MILRSKNWKRFFNQLVSRTDSGERIIDIHETAIFSVALQRAV